MMPVTPGNFTPTAAGRTASFGYGALSGNPQGRGGLGAPAAPGATPQLLPSEPIGMKPVSAGAVQHEAHGLGRIGGFMKGASEAIPGGGGAMGAGVVGEAGAAAETIAPLALVAAL